MGSEQEMKTLNEVFRYLKNGDYPSTYNKSQKGALRRLAKRTYVLSEGKIYSLIKCSNLFL